MKQSEPEYSVKAIDNVLIPMRDGVNLAANLLMPDALGKFPAILTYYPYHKDGLIGKGYVGKEPFGFAQRGYVHVFLDMRGTGSSGGYAPRILSLQQWEDGYDAVEWIAQQPWCDGNVGMWGISYGGSSSTNVAILNPPHLKAIIPIQSSLSAASGVRSCLALGIWGAMMLGMGFMPPLYTDEEGRWLKIWNEHLKHNTELVFEVYKHLTEDEFTREGAALLSLDKIKAATYIMGGWRDVCFAGHFAFYNGISAPKKILMGPWKHGAPSHMVPGPNVDYFDEMVRWFDYWLKGIDTGIVDEPPITMWKQGANARWSYESEWPVARKKETALYLHPGGRLRSQQYEDEDESDSFEHNATVGTCRGLEDNLALPFGLPLDQRVDEALSLTYTTEPLPEDTEITGTPIATLFVSTTADVGVIVAKLNDVAPDGSSAAITYGCLDMAQRESREKLLPVKPEEVYELPVGTYGTCYTVKAGHRIRLAIASSDFPWIWPTPKAAVNTVYYGQKHPSRIVIPIVPEQEPSLPTPALHEVERPTERPATVEYARPYWRIERDPVASTVTVYTGKDEKLILSPTTTHEMLLHGKATASAVDPAATRVTMEARLNIEGHKLGTINIKVDTMMTCEAKHAAINLFVNGLLAFSKTWTSP